MNTRKNNRRPKFQYEQLEGRMMMAGNVTSSLSGGCLQLTGDSKANVIAVTQLPTGDWLVTGLLKTKIDGLKSETFHDVCSIKANLNGGSDAIAVYNGTLSGDLCIDTSTGNDAVVLLNLCVANAYVTTGAGSDLLVAASVTTGQAVSTPTNTVTANSVSQGSSTACFDTGDGTDLVFLTQIHTDNFSLTTGKGTDFVGLLDVCANNCLNVDTGKNFDILIVVHCSADNATFAGGNDSSDIMGTALNDFGSSNSNFKHTYNFDALASSAISWLKSAKSMMLQSLSGIGNLPDLKL